MALVNLVRHAQASFGADDYDRLSELGLRQTDESVQDRFARPLHEIKREQRRKALALVQFRGKLRHENRRRTRITTLPVIRQTSFAYRLNLIPHCPLIALRIHR